MRFVMATWCLMALLLVSAPLGASTGDLSGVIESFMNRQFPDSRAHYWVVNGTQWQAENEIVVDVNTVVLDQPDRPNESRFLLLIVEGRLEAAQNIPLDAATDCQPEEA